MKEITYRYPTPEDAEAMHSLLTRDYERLGITLPHLDERVERLVSPGNRRNSRIVHAQGELAAIMTLGGWRYGDAAPFALGGVYSALLFDKMNTFMQTQGIFVLSADPTRGGYEAGSPLDTAFDEIVPPAMAIEAPMVAQDTAAQQLLARHGFRRMWRARRPVDPIYGELRLWRRTPRQ